MYLNYLFFRSAYFHLYCHGSASPFGQRAFYILAVHRGCVRASAVRVWMNCQVFVLFTQPLVVPYSISDCNWRLALLFLLAVATVNWCSCNTKMWIYFGFKKFNNYLATSEPFSMQCWFGCTNVKINLNILSMIAKNIPNCFLYFLIYFFCIIIWVKH